MSSIYISRYAVAEPGCIVGHGTKIWHFCHIREGATIGANCTIGQGCYVASTARIGDNCRIQNNVSIYDGVVLEEEVFIGPSAVFTNVKRPRAYKRGSFEQTIVKKGATVGANATIVCGVTIGEGAFVGAGSVVTKDVPPYSTVWGVPARAWPKKEQHNGEKEEEVDSV